MPAKILLVEDDLEFLQPLQTILEREGYRTEVAASAAAALHWLSDASRYPDLILLDVGLPDRNMDGLDLCRVLKQDAATKRIPVIILSAHGETEMRAKAADSRADLVLSKPISAAPLIAAVRGQLRTAPTQRRGLLSRAGIELDPDHETVSLDGRLLNAPGPRLFDLLYLLVESAPEPVSRERIVASTRLRARAPELSFLIAQLSGWLRRELGRDILSSTPDACRLDLAGLRGTDR